MLTPSFTDPGWKVDLLYHTLSHPDPCSLPVVNFYIVCPHRRIQYNQYGAVGSQHTRFPLFYIPLYRSRSGLFLFQQSQLHLGLLNNQGDLLNASVEGFPNLERWELTSMIPVFTALTRCVSALSEIADVV